MSNLNPQPSPATEPEVNTPAPLDAEAALRIQKLTLETQLLALQLRPRQYWLDLAKALAGPVAIVGLIVTIYLGVGQLKESRRTRDEERFDKAATRLASPTSTERLSGLTGLELFLQPDQESKHRATVHFIVNALASERDPTVRGALLDAISQLTAKVISQSDLDDALERLRDRNRAIYAQHRSIYLDKLIADPQILNEKGNDEVPIGRVSQEDLAPLVATARAITAIVRNGARAKDLSGIYCVDCDFSGKTMDMTSSDFAKVSNFAQPDSTNILDLSGTDFHDAILKKSNFVGVNLHDVSFEGADLIGINFSGADLSDAKLTDYGHHEYVVQGALAVGYLYGAQFPDFTCADLSRADFTGSLFFGIYRSRPNSVFAAYPILHNANLLNAKLGQMKVFAASPAPDPSYSLTPQQLLDALPFVSNRQIDGYTNVPVKNWLNEPVVIKVFTVGPDFKIKEPVRQDDWASMHLVFSNLASARNFDKSGLPPEIIAFIKRNPQSFSGSPHPTPCTPKN